MSTAAMISICCLFVLLVSQNVDCQAPRKRFEYKLSFKGPHLVQRDNTVPFWEYFGDALAGDEGIRITPSLRSKKGSVWSKNKLESTGWEIEAGVRVTGRGRVGADGMAIWFTENRAAHTDNPTEQTVFGAPDKWNGMGVFLDSFDNDAQHNNPYIMVVTNDGSLTYDHQNDGSSQSLGGCLRDFRNKPFPVRVKIEYYNKMLSVKVNNGLTNNADDFELCMSASNINLPTTGYIGVSAATGGLADDHDVLYMLTHSLTDPSTETAQVSEEEKLKFENEFKQYQEELDAAKKQYKVDNPNEAKDPYDFEGNEEDWFQSQNDKELKQIFDGQNLIHMVMKDLSRKLDELMGRQEMVLSRVNNIPQGQGQQQQQQQGQQQAPPQVQGTVGSAGISKQEFDAMMRNQNTLLQQLGDMRYVINDIQTKAGTIQNQGAQAGGQGAQAGVQGQMAIHELKDKMQNMANDVRNLANRPQPQLQCPPSSASNCLSPMLFFVALTVQFILTIGYMVYRSNKEQQNKKFY